MDNTKKSKLLVVDDSAFMRKLISDFFADHLQVEVVGSARNGKDAIKKIQQLNPDVVTMDVEMPEMNGLDALKEIMQVCPVPVVMLSSTTQQNADNTLTAMEYGAVDFVAKPGGTISLDLHKIQDELVRKVEEAAKIPIVKLKKTFAKSSTFTKDLVKPVAPVAVTAITKKTVSTMENLTKKVDWNKASKKIILIGTSTGGPRALQEVITKIPSTVDAPILIVQHMPAGFTKSLATRLDQLSEIHVKEAEQGDILQKGTAYIAPGGYHLKLRKVGSSYAVVLDQTEPPRSGHRPSVDVMFEDVSQYSDFDKVAVIMTGMGYDGSKGLIALKKTGNVIAIAESAETCIVYGMPKAAVETQLVDEMADVDDIAQTIMKYMP
ncbi:chemotaxis response regulator protein-glutamate methylesterase [Lysinibacillus sp. 2017]|uniref:protein-glutamate methylesterase/protein-glutamine glutaminase n=1 Tax=unclassified Lysinibacillus TaxID=2636778 RepID=UPI000D5283BC|nr:MULTISPECIES: chemotaxis response regulator protein-glutamate methylesterase [unclassified Lysinibacillus]AWE06695.1 chemotaxis response regulator protein-glutamate methylesterase [Lysinibacillus sp. 2017]TGN37373.1 chemotaxis response regulator protein-glutamate methylesterase [Lysinibacillus sp. S2017]